MARCRIVYRAFAYITSSRTCHFIAANSKNRRSNNLSGVRIDAHLDETLCSWPVLDPRTENPTDRVAFVAGDLIAVLDCQFDLG